MTTNDEREQWEQNNESFSYEAPDQPPDAWSQGEFTELWDRQIMRRVTWECQYCNQPQRGLEAARRHVSNQHGEELIEKVQR